MRKVLIFLNCLTFLVACGGPDGTAEDSDGLSPENHRIFVSSTTYSGGQIASQSSAQTKCTELAKAAGLVRTYKAILSTQADPATNYLDITGSIYIFTDAETKKLVASTVSDLWDAEVGNTLLNGVDRDESYNTVTGERVWTGTNNNGGTANANCDDWNDVAQTGWYGLTAAVDDTWLEKDTASCSNSYRIYCISQ